LYGIIGNYMKKSWTTPELIVVVRSTPEENVLAGCKHPAVHSGPNTPNCKIQGSGKDECNALIRS
jgi:hypothetical protein